MLLKYFVRSLHLGFNTEFVVLERLLGAELLLKHRKLHLKGRRQNFHYADKHTHQYRLIQAQSLELALF